MGALADALKSDRLPQRANLSPGRGFRLCRAGGRHDFPAARGTADHLRPAGRCGAEKTRNACAGRLRIARPNRRVGHGMAGFSTPSSSSCRNEPLVGSARPPLLRDALRPSDGPLRPDRAARQLHGRQTAEVLGFHPPESGWPLCAVMLKHNLPPRDFSSAGKPFRVPGRSDRKRRPRATLRGGPARLPAAHGRLGGLVQTDFPNPSLSAPPRYQANEGMNLGSSRPSAISSVIAPM